ncbi:MAG: hypothetical protein CL503_05245 [Actinobacteria bacterium]|nr:hypothetical protein [Actinomycetota bacterium]
MSLSSICGYCSPEKAAVTIQRSAAIKIQAMFRGQQSRNKQLRNKQLLEAAESGDINQTKHLITHGADVNATDKHGRTALHEAAYYGNLEIVKALVIAGADINAKDNVGLTPLINATYKGNLEIVEALVNAGADINAKGRYGMTALHWAADNGSEDIVKALVRAGADVNVTDRFGFTALHWAADKGCEDIVKALVIAGADLTDNVGWRIAIKWAKKYGHYDKVKNAIKEGKQKLISLYENQQCQLKTVVNSPIYLQLEDLEEPLLKNEPEKLNETQREQARKYIEKEEQSFPKKFKRLGNIKSLIKNTFGSEKFCKINP